MKQLSFAYVILLSMALLSACNQNDIDADITSEIPAPSTSIPTRRVMSTSTPTPAPMTVTDVYENVAHAVAFIETPIRTGSGVLVEGGYIITNAHVVWPFQEARVVFPDGSEYPSAPVVNWDLLVDLAILGPIETQITPAPLVDGENLPIGSEVFLIGYPGEDECFPQPTITRGLVCRRREWEATDITYFQTDALIVDGQSGGVLVSKKGDIIGLSGLSYSEGKFGLVASAKDIAPRIQHLITSEDTALGNQKLPLSGGHSEHHYKLNNQWDSRIYVINEPPQTPVNIEVWGTNDVVFAVWDVMGHMRVFANERNSGLESGSTTTELAAPYIVLLSQYSETPGEFNIRSNCQLAPCHEFDGPDQALVNQTIRANIDTPGDLDYFVIELDAGDTINVTVDSIMIDPVVGIDFFGATQNQWVSNDNDGDLFGENSGLTYTAPHSGEYYIVVYDADRVNVGGYLLTVTAIANTVAASTPSLPEPMPTPTPRPTPIVPMIWYESKHYPFAIQYPDTLIAQPERDRITVAYADSDIAFSIFEENLTDKVGIMTLEEYVDAFILWAPYLNENFKLFARRRGFNDQGLPVQIVEYTSGPEGTIKTSYFFYVHQGVVGFNASYTAQVSNHDTLKPIIDFSFATFKVTF